MKAKVQKVNATYLKKISPEYESFALEDYKMCYSDIIKKIDELKA